MIATRAQILEIEVKIKQYRHAQAQKAKECRVTLSDTDVMFSTYRTVCEAYRVCDDGVAKDFLLAALEQMRKQLQTQAILSGMLVVASMLDDERGLR